MHTHALVQLPGYWADKLCSAFLGESPAHGAGSGAEGAASPVCVSVDMASSHRAAAQR